MTRSTRLNAAAGTALVIGISGSVVAAEDTHASAAPQGVPVIVLMPVAIATAADFSNGCWTRLYDSTDFRGNQLSLVRPIDMPNMRTAFGTDWSGDFDSIQTGPNTTMTVGAQAGCPSSAREAVRIALRARPYGSGFSAASLAGARLSECHRHRFASLGVLASACDRARA